MLTKDEYMSMGDEYLTLEKIAAHLLNLIKCEGAIDLADLQTFHDNNKADLTESQKQEFEKDGLYKFYIEPLLGYGFIEEEYGCWSLVRDRSSKVERLLRFLIDDPA